MSSFKHPKCYASALGGCSKTVTAEHFVSRSVLEFLCDGFDVEFKGFPWQEGDRARCPSPASLTGKMLCSRHNSDLHSLDDEALALFHAFDRVHKTMLDDTRSGASEIRIKGELFERRVLKAAFGFMASGNCRRREGLPRKMHPPLPMLEVLFGLRPMPQPFGLFLAGPPGEHPMGRTHVSLQSFFDKNGPNAAVPNLVAVGCDVDQFRFRLALCQLPSDRTGTPFENALYHPHHLSFVHSGRPCKVKVLLDWKDSPHGGYGFDVHFAPTDKPSAFPALN
jgi:hypothetical protein